ncbi:MAG TPA: dihydrofolate reductase family protein [Devosia sp.]|nr:dihydrofolate reductase family protein [Devosia sp.]
MRKLRYSINVTLDGCVDHRVGVPDDEMHNFHAGNVARAGALLYGRVTYQMMEAWRPVARGEKADWVEDWMVPFAQAIDAAKKYVVSDTLDAVDWNAELVRGVELEAKVRALKAQPGNEIATGGVTLPLALAELGLIDEYEFVVMPRIAGHGPRLLDGLTKMVDLKLVERREFGSGAVVLRYEAKP